MADAQVTTQTIRKERAPGGDIPETWATYIAMNPDKFVQSQTVDRDTERVMKMSRSGIEKSDAEAVAWLLWRARMVIGWSAVNRKPTKTWEEAVQAAWTKDELFQMCNEKRKRFYEEREARRERLSRSFDGLEN